MFQVYVWLLASLLLNNGLIRTDELTRFASNGTKLSNNTVEEDASTRTNILVVKEDDTLFEEGSTGSDNDFKDNIQFVFPQNTTDYADDELSGSSGDEGTALEYTGEILGEGTNSSLIEKTEKSNNVAGLKGNSLNSIVGSNGNSQNNSEEEENEDSEDDEDESEEKAEKGKSPINGKSSLNTQRKLQSQQKSTKVAKNTKQNNINPHSQQNTANQLNTNLKQINNGQSQNSVNAKKIASLNKKLPSNQKPAVDTASNAAKYKAVNNKEYSQYTQQAVMTKPSQPAKINQKNMLKSLKQGQEKALESQKTSPSQSTKTNSNVLPNTGKNPNNNTSKITASMKYVVISADENNKTKTTPLNDQNNNKNRPLTVNIWPNSTKISANSKQQEKQQSLTNSPTHGAWKTIDVSGAMIKQNNISSNSNHNHLKAVNPNPLNTLSKHQQKQKDDTEPNQFKNADNTDSNHINTVPITQNVFTNVTNGSNLPLKPTNPGLNLEEHLNNFVSQKSVSKKIKQKHFKQKSARKKLSQHAKKLAKQNKRKVKWVKKQRKAKKQTKKQHAKAKKRDKKIKKHSDSTQPPKKIPESEYKEINSTEKNKASKNKDEDKADEGSASGDDSGKSESSSQGISKEKGKGAKITKITESEELEGSGEKDDDPKKNEKNNKEGAQDDKEHSTGEAVKNKGKIKIGDTNSNKEGENNGTKSDDKGDSTVEDPEKNKESNKEALKDISSKVENTQALGGGDKDQTSGQNERTKNLQKTLSRLRFMNGASGKVHTGQQFSYISQCGLYTEPQNVSLPQHSWVTKTYSPYFYLYEKPKDYEKCKPSDWMFGKDMRGSVFLSFEVKSLHGSNLTNNAKICEKYCCKEPRCQAWVVRFQDSATNNCPDKSFCCWLKNDIPPVEDYYLEGASVAGIVHRKHYRHPPTGMRSAVPLGGLGAGSFEMRADGTFHEWTIENQSPGGSAKLSKSALEKMFLGVRVQTGNATARSAILRTHSMREFENETVKSLEYFGAHPVSKFAIEMDDKKEVNMNLYAFSPFHPRDATESATPAVSFSLEVNNPSENEEIEVSFMLNIPFGYNEDTVRKGGNYQEADFTRAVTPSDCQRECAKRPDCQSWTTNGPNTCMLKDTIPLHSYDYGIVSGIRGDWDVKEGMLSCQRPGDSPQSGDITMYPLQTGTEDQSFVVTDNISKVWKNFKTHGQLNGNSTHTMKLNTTGLHGAASVTTKLKPKETKLLTIIFAWYFPNKDIADERVGNFYTNLFKSSSDVAKHFEGDLVSTVTDISNWHSSVFTPNGLSVSNNGTETPDADDFIKKSDGNDSEDDKEDKDSQTKCATTVNGVSTLPTCLQDLLVNSMSFLRTAMWFENGRWRQWEAFDCANLDPVHIDFHRIIPYMIFYPDLVKQLMFSWADHQLTNLENGMIQESLSQGCLEETSREGTAGGRQMTDVNVGFISQAYMVYQWTNDTDFFDQIYPYAKRATHWLIHRATKGSGLPYRKPDAYDLFELEKYDHSAYNSVLYLLALKAMKKMAEIRKDTATVNDVEKALERAQKLFEVEMWDQRKGFYHAWFDDEWGTPGWLMSDILYGQVWSYTLGLGELLDTDKMKKHLRKEVSRNDSPYGLKVLTKNEEVKQTEDTSIILGEEANSCKSLENITKTHSIWMSSSTDWSTLQLHLGTEPEEAMDQAIKSLDNYRSTLRDQWNIHGMTSSSHYGLDGLPWATSHYTLHLMLWHLPLALSGQQYNAPEGKIIFDPKYTPPYWLPFYTPSCMGNIEAKDTSAEKNSQTEIMYTINVSSGRCKFNKLQIAKSKYDGSVNIGEGDSLSWSVPKFSQEEKIKSMLNQLKH